MHTSVSYWCIECIKPADTYIPSLHQGNEEMKTAADKNVIGFIYCNRFIEVVR